MPEEAKRDGLETLKFCQSWRARILAKHPGNPQQLSDEEFGRLVALNTIISFITEK